MDPVVMGWGAVEVIPLGVAAASAAAVTTLTRRLVGPLTRWTPAVEIVAGLVAAALVARMRGAQAAASARGLPPWDLASFGEGVALTVLAAGLSVLSAVDLDRRLLPVRVLYPTLGGVVAGYATAAAGGAGTTPLLRALLAGVAMAALFLVVHLIRPEGMGFGDVRLAGLVGVALGWTGWSVAVAGVLAGLVSGALAGLAGIVTGRMSRHDTLPFGPFLAAGAVAALLVVHGW